MGEARPGGVSPDTNSPEDCLCLACARGSVPGHERSTARRRSAPTPPPARTQPAATPIHSRTVPVITKPPAPTRETRTPCARRRHAVTDWVRSEPTPIFRPRADGTARRVAPIVVTAIGRTVTSETTAAQRWTYERSCRRGWHPRSRSRRPCGDHRSPPSLTRPYRWRRVPSWMRVCSTNTSRGRGVGCG